MKRTALLIPLVLIMMLATVAAASARRGDPPPEPPVVTPVEVNEVCRERLPGGIGFGWYADGCNLAYQTIVFDGVTDHDFCFGGYGDQVLHQPGPYGCGLFSTPVTINGDNSVDACLNVHGRVEAPWSSGCVTPAVL